MHIPYDLYSEHNTNVHRNHQIVGDGIPHGTILEPVVLPEKTIFPKGENGVVNKLPSLHSIKPAI